jgi:hypothetical protein
MQLIAEVMAEERAEIMLLEQDRDSDALRCLQGTLATFGRLVVGSSISANRRAAL